MEAFGIGDIVTLKSGSLDMVVEGFVDQPVPHPHLAKLVRCVWMADGTINEHVFAPHLLVGKAKTEPEPIRKAEPESRTLVAV